MKRKLSNNDTENEGPPKKKIKVESFNDQKLDFLDSLYEHVNYVYQDKIEELNKKLLKYRYDHKIYVINKDWYSMVILCKEPKVIPNNVTLIPVNVKLGYNATVQGGYKGNLDSDSMLSNYEFNSIECSTTKELKDKDALLKKITEYIGDLRHKDYLKEILTNDNNKSFDSIVLEDIPNAEREHDSDYHYPGRRRYRGYLNINVYVLIRE